MLKIHDLDLDINIIGTRHGEKHYESLIGSEEMNRAIEEDRFYRIVADDRDLNYEKYFSIGSQNKDFISNEYNSSNTTRLSISEIISILKETFKESLGAPSGLPKESPVTPSGIPKGSLRNPQGMPTASLGNPRESLGNP